jgi:hypothetical protein
MVQDAFADPIARSFEETQPKWMLRRLPPSAAGEAIVTGIERRAPRIIAPKWWAVWSVLRGILNPLFDARAERDARLQEVVREGDSPDRSRLKQGTAPPAP